MARLRVPEKQLSLFEADQGDLLFDAYHSSEPKVAAPSPEQLSLFEGKVPLVGEIESALADGDYGLARAAYDRLRSTYPEDGSVAFFEFLSLFPPGVWTAPIRLLEKTMTWVAGADGCKAGWVVVLREVQSRRLEVKLACRVEDVFRWNPSPEILGIDIPIGLLDRAVPGGRDCDRAARALLGRPRGTSVFSPPARRALKARLEDADEWNRETGPGAPGLSRQSCAIIPKIREVDELLTRSFPRRIVEVHPEMCFYEMNRKGPVVEPKKTAAGRKRRIRLLEGAWRRKLSDFIESRPRGVGRDDIIDAMAVCWTAERVLRKKEIRLLSEPRRDSRGLRMEIVR